MPVPSPLAASRAAQPQAAVSRAPLTQDSPALHWLRPPVVESELQRLRRAWASLRRPDSLLDLFTEFGLTAAQALSRADPRFVQRLELGSAQQLFRAAAEAGLPLRLNSPPTPLQQRGVVHSVVQQGPCLWLCGPCIELMLREDQLGSAWLLTQPTVDGSTSVLMLFDTREQVMLVVGEDRPAGRPERCSWRQLLAELVQDMAWAEG